MLLPDDEAIELAVQSCAQSMFLTLCDGEEEQAKVRRALLEAARSFANRVLLALAPATECPRTRATYQVTASPTHLFLVSTRKLASMEGGIVLAEFWRWMVNTAVRFTIPPMKHTPSPCLRCGGRTLIRCLPVEQAVVEGTDYTTACLRRMAVTYVARTTPVTTGALGTSTTELCQDPGAAAGALEAFVCKACGHVEWFATGAEDIPIGPEHRTELIELKGQSPYR